MLTVVIFLLVYGLLNYYIYKRISLGFGFSLGRKTILKLVLILGGSLYFSAYLVQSLFSIDLYPLLYAGVFWVFGIIFLFGLSFLETGFSMVFPSRTRWWISGALVLLVPIIFHLSTLIPYREKIPVFREVSRWMILAGIFSLVIIIVYKIIAKTLKLPLKKRGILIIVFSTAAILPRVGFEPGGIPLLLGLIAVIFVRISIGLNFSKRGNIIMFAVFCAGFCLLIPRFFVWGHNTDIHRLYYIVGLWQGLIHFALILFLLESGVALLFPSHPRRRVTIFLLILALAYGYAVYNGARAPVVKELSIPIKTLPKNMSGFTIVQLTDLHLGDVLSAGWLRKTVEKTNSLEPDLVVITGDLIDTNRYEEYLDFLCRLKAKFGIIAVTGNHEYNYYKRYDNFLKIAKKMGMRVLRNQSMTVSEAIQVVGINDPYAGNCGESKPDLKVAMKNVDPRKPVILLSHQPDFFDEASQHGVDLQLSGHTHGGQFFPVNLILHLTYNYPHGLYRKGDSYLYTSSGTGLYSPPLRLFTQNEIVRITLVSK